MSAAVGRGHDNAATAAGTGDNMTGRIARGFVGAVLVGATLGAVAGLGGPMIGNTGHGTRDTRPVVRTVAAPAVTTTTTAAYRGPVAVMFGTGTGEEDSPATVDALALCAQASGDCWYSAGGTVTGNVSARLMVDWITCDQAHAHDGLAAGCHAERDADGSRSIYDGTVGR